MKCAFAGLCEQTAKWLWSMPQNFRRFIARGGNKGGMGGDAGSQILPRIGTRAETAHRFSTSGAVSRNGHGAGLKVRRS
jgi:hypothetical protein